MPDLAPRERLQPSLLDRLTDHAPEQREEAWESRVLGEAQLRESIRRDLTWLLNTTHLAALQDLSLYPEVARSTLNYGIPDLAGQTLSGIDEGKLERLVREAILRYEPRLLGETLRLKAIAEAGKDGRNRLVFAIEGEMWAEPVPRALFLRTEFDLEDGSARVEVARADGPR
jgi:type VI secretion system protein ImpF